MKYRFLFPVLFFMTLAGCGVLFGDPNDGGSSDPTYEPDLPRTEGSYSFSYHAGETQEFLEGESKVAGAWYDGTNTNVRMGASLRNDRTYAYFMVLTFPGDQTGTFTAVDGEITSTFTSYDGVSDGGVWEGTFTSSPQGDCTADQLAQLESGFISVTGYGAPGERIVGTYDVTYNQIWGCGTLRRFHGSFDIVRGY